MEQICVMFMTGELIPPGENEWEAKRSRMNNYVLCLLIYIQSGSKGLV